MAALGLSNKAVYADQEHDSNGGVASGMQGGSYTDGPDLAPNAMPAAVSGLLCPTALQPKKKIKTLCLQASWIKPCPQKQPGLLL